MKLSYKVSLIFFLYLIFSSACADVVVVVGSTSSVDNLTKRQVSDIFLGKTSSYPGGGKAVAIDHKDGSSERKDFYKKVIAKSSNQLKSYWSKLIFSGKGQPPKQLANASDVKKSISSNPDQISYINEDAVDSSVKVVFKP